MVNNPLEISLSDVIKPCERLIDYIKVYDDICDAFKQAAIEKGVAVKWGAAWSEGDIRFYKGNAEFHMNRYIDKRRADGRRPFIDGPHFELIV